jgi:tetratricopeptide (TPR) repeat protein
VDRLIPPAALLGACLALAACAGNPVDQGEKLYREGALREAVEVWHSVPRESSARGRAEERIAVVAPEMTRLLRRFEKQAQFFESEGRLGEAVLYYRLAHRIDPSRVETLDHVQRLARELQRQREAERQAMHGALAAGQLLEASTHAQRLAQLDPFDPAAQIELRRVRDAIGTEVVRHVEAGKAAYAAGDRETALSEFRAVQAIDAYNQEALGYLGYLQGAEAEGDEADPETAQVGAAGGASARLPPASLSREKVLAEGRFRSGQQAERRGDPFRALDEFEAALQLNPAHAGARRARERLRRSLASRVDELYEQGARYFQEDDLQNALRSWRRVLAIQPGHAKAAENADRARRMIDRLEEIQTGGG